MFGDDATAGAEHWFDEVQSDDLLVPVARFKSAAEAGYFAHELLYTEHLPVSLIAEEHFDALDGHWSTRFVLSAPEGMADRAARALAQLIEQTETEETCDAVSAAGSSRLVMNDPADSDRQFDPATVAIEESAVHWVPIVLTLAAGSVALWGVHHLNERPKQQFRAVPAGRQHDDLWEQLSLPARVWTQRLENGRGRRELWIDRKRNIAVIREDADGDGVFEKEVPFRRAP